MDTKKIFNNKIYIDNKKLIFPKFIYNKERKEYILQ